MRFEKPWLPPLYFFSQLKHVIFIFSHCNYVYPLETVNFIKILLNIRNSEIYELQKKNFFQFHWKLKNLVFLVNSDLPLPKRIFSNSMRSKIYNTLLYFALKGLAAISSLRITVFPEFLTFFSRKLGFLSFKKKMLLIFSWITDFFRKTNSSTQFYVMYVNWKFYSK